MFFNVITRKLYLCIAQLMAFQVIQIIFDYERSSRRDLLEFGVRVSLRKGTRSLKMETDNRVSVMENLEIEVEWCHCFKYLRLQHLGYIGIFLLSYGLAYSPFIQLLVIVYLLHASCVQMQGIVNKVNMWREDSKRARMRNKLFYMLETNMTKKVNGWVQLQFRCTVPSNVHCLCYFNGYLNS